MLIRISLIVAIIAGLAVGALNFSMVKEKITTLQKEYKDEKDAHTKTTATLNSTKKELDKTATKLKQTEATLATTTEEKDRALAEASSQQKRADKVTDERDKARRERDDAQAELAAYKATELKPEEIIAFRKQYKGLQDSLQGAKDENKLLGQQIVKLKNELAIYKSPDTYVVPLPPDLRGKVIVNDPKWNFVVLNVGQDQGVLEYGELLVNRNGKLVAKVRVRSVQKDRSIANVLPGWQLGEILEGDQVIPAHPAS
jgi:hypothetical protein